MTHAFTRKQISLAVSCTLLLAVAASTANAEVSPADKGYLTDVRGTVVRSDYNLCWRSGTGPISEAECNPTAAPAPVAQVVQPAPKPAAPAPAPIAAATPAVERITLDADALFDFDKAVLRPAGMIALDGFAGKLKDINPEVINATGHTDRFGSESYNQGLSERRVAAVKTYLVSKGIESSRMHTEGKGEMEPVTKSGECDGAKSTKVVACLQPDRRVEVEVVGNRIDTLSPQR